MTRSITGALLLTLAATILLSGCGQEEPSYVGTWKSPGSEFEGRNGTFYVHTTRDSIHTVFRSGNKCQVEARAIIEFDRDNQLLRSKEAADAFFERTDNGLSFGDPDRPQERWLLEPAEQSPLSSCQS